MAQHYAVVGNPISHSKSPQIHAMFAKQFGIELRYDRVRFANKGLAYFSSQMQRLAEGGLVGANVTVPFKLDAFAFAQVRSARALAAKAVNTLHFHGETGWYGDNTDGAGLVLDLQRLCGNLSGAKVLIIGAGGATQGCVLPLLHVGAQVIISNRTHEKAKLLAQQFGVVAVSTMQQIERCDIVINATAASLQGQALLPNPGAISESTLCYDMMYGNEATLFMQGCQSLNARTSDGFGMLVGQAAESFYLWHGVRPDISPVLQALRPI